MLCWALREMGIIMLRTGTNRVTKGIDLGLTFFQGRGVPGRRGQDDIIHGYNGVSFSPGACDSED